MLQNNVSNSPYWSDSVTKMLHNNKNLTINKQTSKNLYIFNQNKPKNNKGGFSGQSFAIASSWRLKLAFKIENIYKEMGLDKKAKKIGICANTVEMRREIKSGVIYASGVRCHDRICPVCNSFRAGKLARRVEDVLSKMFNPHFLTITNSGRVDKLDFHFKDFQERSKKLRRSKFWKDNIRGGMYFIEVTKNKDGWHIHSHYLVDVIGDNKIFNIGGDFTNSFVTPFKKQLEGSLVSVGLGAISSINPCEFGIGKEISKYLAKMGLNMLKEDIKELITELKNKRVMGAFGSVSKNKKKVCDDTDDVDDDMDDLEDEQEYESLGSIKDVVMNWYSYGEGVELVLYLVKNGFIELQSLDYFFSSA